ncbi:MAG TPA: cytochrome c oxidase subunit II [Acidimicrobiales bacterium]|nr:cytochrome c oxidase subunit II [Acidimicrobiales bacterium]
MDQPGAAPSHDRHARSSAGPHRRLLAVAAVLVTGLTLSGCQLPTFGAYRGSTSQGQDAFKLWQFFFITGIIVGGFVILLILWSVFRYRRRSDEMPKQTQYHTGVEILYTVIPIVIVLVLFAFTVITENKVDATPPADVTIRVTAFQWGWRFYYPATGKVVTGETTQAPQMVVPTGQSVQIMLGSADVIHGFYVPAFNFSRYAQPGVTASQQRFNFTVLHDGVYRGQCTQLCGLYHSLMFFSVKAVPPAQFQVWVHHLSKNQPSISQLKQEIQANGPGG